MLILIVGCILLAGCTRLNIETPSGYKIDRLTLLNNRSESLTLYDPDSGKPLGEYRRVDDEQGTDAMAILAETIGELAERLERQAAAGAAGGV